MERLYKATSLADVQQFVRGNNQFKVLGTRHCFNDIADTATQFLSLKSLDKVVKLDPQAQTVTIEAGLSYG
jgi:alditol oxidase